MCVVYKHVPRNIPYGPSAAVAPHHKGARLTVSAWMAVSSEVRERSTTAPSLQVVS